MWKLEEDCLSHWLSCKPLIREKKLYPVNELFCFSKNLLADLNYMNSTYYDRSGFCCHDTEMMLGFLPFIISFSGLSCNLSSFTWSCFFSLKLDLFWYISLLCFIKMENHLPGKTSANLWIYPKLLKIKFLLILWPIQIVFLLCESFARCQARLR